MPQLIAAVVVLIVGAGLCLLRAGNRTRIAFGLTSQAIACLLVWMLPLDLPRRLLHALAERFAIPAIDPVRQLFTGLDAAQTAHIDTLHLPPAWRHMTTSSGRPLHRLDPSVSIAIDLQRLLHLLQLLAALLLRRHCRLSLRALIQRPGRVVLTATHWDVIFDLNQIDLRLRRVALDTDPGWVGWLGRVVQFHYHRAGAQHAVNQ